jgi:hypothetical protein
MKTYVGKMYRHAEYFTDISPFSYFNMQFRLSGFVLRI